MKTKAEKEASGECEVTAEEILNADKAKLAFLGIAIFAISMAEGIRLNDKEGFGANLIIEDVIRDLDRVEEKL